MSLEIAGAVSTCEDTSADAPARGSSAWSIEEGDLLDYRALSVFHYRAGPPTGVAGVLRLMHRDEGGRSIRAGVLVIAYPALWCTWHRRIWPERFGRVPRGKAGERSEIDGLNEAERLNCSLRMISRVVIDPRFRGLGAASMLVASYLRSPRTPLTAALASMGRCCPFFASAGMAAHELPRSSRDEALCTVFAERGVTPWRLADSAYAGRMVKDGLIRRAIESWHAKGASARHRSRSIPLVELAMLAGSSLYARPLVYAHGV